MKKMSLERTLAHKKNLERIIDSLAEGIIAHDRERRIVYFNREAEKITGFSRKQVLGRDCHDAFGGPFCGGRCSFSEDPPANWVDMEYPLNIVTAGGENRRIEMRVSGMTDEAGDFIGIIAAFRDVTDITGLRIALGKLRGFSGIIGKDPKILNIFQQIRDLSTNDYPVHISGETGTGKELVANAIHEESRRGGAPFVPVNCAALPEGILESELFGHVKGAFTGAVRDKKGRFELAHGGTLFLDEVADLPKVMQAKILRVIQDKSFERVGGERTISVDVRIISATNKDLRSEVKKGSFRDDLYYRLNVVPVIVPPLRERKADLPLLIEHFLETAKEEGQSIKGISQQAMDLALDYDWPGNVRELQSAVRFATVRSRGEIIGPEHLPLELSNMKKMSGRRGPAVKLEKTLVKDALTESGGNKAEAARILGVGRATLYRFLKNNTGVS